MRSAGAVQSCHHGQGMRVSNVSLKTVVGHIICKPTLPRRSRIKQRCSLAKAHDDPTQGVSCDPVEPSVEPPVEPSVEPPWNHQWSHHQTESEPFAIRRDYIERVHLEQ